MTAASDATTKFQKGFAWGLAIMIVISLLSFHQISLYNARTTTHQKLDQLTAEFQQFEVRLREAEAQHLGFIASGEELFVQNYNEAVRGFIDSSKRVKLIAADVRFEAKELPVLLDLTEEKFAIMNKSMKLKNQGQSAEARKLLVKSEAVQMSQKIHTQFRLIENYIVKDLRAKDSGLRQSAQVIQVLIILGTLIASLLLVLNRRTQARASENFRQLSRVLSQGQEELILANQKARVSMQAKSDFLANMSHEVRTPMNAINGLSLILKKSGLNPEQLKLVDGIQKSTLSLLDVINPVLDVSKIEHEGVQLEFEEGVDLRRLIEECVTIMKGQAELKNLVLKTELPAEIGFFRADAPKLKQVFLNLLGNAIKFTERGSVTFRLEIPGAGDFDKELRFSVVDTGIGIADSAKDRLFQSFNQSDNSVSRRFGGTGLGLSISKSIVEAMGGYIGFNSKEGLGTTFFVSIRLGTSLPVVPKLNVVSVAWVPSKNKVQLALSALVIEDNPMNQFVLENFLKDIGVTSVLTSSGPEGLAKLASGRAFDVIFLDVQMPGMDGFEVTRLIREMEQTSTRKNVIVATTAHAMSGYREKCIDAGMTDYLMKPIDPEKLLAMLQKYSGITQVSSINEKRWTRLQSSKQGPEMIEIFSASTPAKMIELRSALENENWAVAEECAHFLKSSASSMAFDLWTQQLSELEAHCAEGRGAEALVLWPAVEGEYHNLTAWLAAA
jgi:signal transduction histidine kinase/DNA-binding NarL/FixJ family response regulator